MKLKEILNVSGVSGLFKVITSTKSGLIVESLVDGKRQPVSATHKVSALGDIFIYRNGDEMPLVEVFKKIKETDGEKPSMSPKADDAELKKYFRKIVPDYDEDRVHASHIKKIITWYDILSGKIDFDKQDEESGEEDSGGGSRDESGKPVVKMHEGHAPKADQHAKTTTVKLRKKV